MNFLFITLLCCIVVNKLSVTLAKKSYSGYQVFRAKVTTKKQQDVLADLKNKGKFDFWNGPTRMGSTNIMASPEEINFLKDVFKRNGIAYSLVIEDVQPIVEKRSSNLERVSRLGQIDWIDYNSYPDISEWMDKLPVQYPNLVTTGSIGKSYEGRIVKFVKISDSTSTDSKTTVFIDGCFHAREWISPATVTYFINEILTKPHEYGAILKHVDFYIVPVVNPDGYEYSRTEKRLWRKTLSKQGNSGCVGVDLNRNFDHDWGGPGSSSETCADNYQGPTVFSEIEARNIRDIVLTLIKTTNLQLYISVHSYGQYILIPWSSTTEKPAPFYDEMEEMAERAADALSSVHGTEYEVGQSSLILYPIAGGSDDWVKDNNVKFSFTFELRGTENHAFLLPSDMIIPTAEETVAAFKEMCLTFVPDSDLRTVIKKRAKKANNMNFADYAPTTTPSNIPMLLMLIVFIVQFHR